MSELSIRLIYNLETGKKDILIDFISDEDALPIEHETAHRQAIETLIGRGLLTPDELGAVKLTRLNPRAAAPTLDTPLQRDHAAPARTPAR